MASDPSVFAQLGRGVTPIANPTDQFLKSVQTYNVFANMQKLGMDLAGRRALQQAYQGVAIDPQTGLPDSNQLVRNLQNTPGGGLVLPQVIQSLQEQQGRLYGLNKQSLEQTTARTNAVNSALGPLMRMGANVTPQDIFSAVGGMHAAGFPTDEFVNDAAATLPARQPGQSDQQYGQQLQSWVVNHAARAWDPGTQAARFTPTPTTVDTGGQIITRDTNPYTNPGILNAAPIGRTLSPGEQASQVKGPLGPNGQPTVIPQATYATNNGMGNLVPGNTGTAPSPFGGGRFPSSLLNPSNNGGGGQPSAPGAAPPSAPQQPSAAIPAGYLPASQLTQPAAPSNDPAQPNLPAWAMPGQPSAAQPTAAPQSAYAPPSAPAAPQMPAPGQPMATGLSPAQQAGMDAAGAASAKQWAGMQASVGGSAARIYQLKSALGDLQALGTTGTGPSAGTVNNVKSYLQSLPGVGTALGFDTNNIANYDQANKYLTGYAAARAGARGGTTDNQLATTLSSNASTSISNLAATNVVKANIGLERMDQAQVAGFQNGIDPATGQPTGQKLTPDQFSDYSAKFNTSMDPRAFIADQLTPQQFTATVNGMQPAERQRFQTSFTTALSNGWIDPPAWMTGQPAASGGAAPGAAAPASPQQQPSPAPAPVQATPAAPPLNVTGAGQPAAMGH